MTLPRSAIRDPRSRDRLPAPHSPSMTNNDKFTDDQRAVRQLLPATSGELADQLGISRSAVRGRIARMDDVERYDDGAYRIAGEDDPEDFEVRVDPVDELEDPFEQLDFEPITDIAGGGEDHDHGDDGDEQPPVRDDRIDPTARQSKTRTATEALVAIERESANLLREARELHPLPDRPLEPLGEVDVLIPRSDDHFGATAETYDHELGRVVETFNLDIARQRVNRCTEVLLERLDRLADAYQLGTCHFALLGDSVTGEDIYDSQPHEIDGTLREQLNVAAECYFTQLAVLAGRFEHVHVPSVPGNHGEIRSSSPSSDNNADSFLYDRLESMVRVSSLENVSFTRAWRTSFVDFDIRGWTVHARHGQSSLSHIGTSSGKNRWRGWLDDSGFDLGLRGHYHEKKREPVRGRPVLMSGSICPPGDLEERISEYSPAGAMLYLIGDGPKPLEASFDIHF